MTSRVPITQASKFLKWFNFNPVSMEIRYQYFLKGSRWLGDLRHTRKEWFAYLRTLDLVTPRLFLHILWNEIVMRPYLAILRWRRGER